MSEFFGLREADPEHVARLQSTACRSINVADFVGWESALKDPAKDPRPHMRAQMQKRNDCQGQALCNGTEKRDWYVTGEMRQRSDIWAYNASEYIDTGGVGRDQGTSIQSGVELLTDGIPKLDLSPGLPLDTAWRYSDYMRNTSQWANKSRSLELGQSYVTEQQPAPDFETTLAALAAGASVHIGTYWSVRWKPLGGKREMSAVPRGGGGHATEAIWAEQINGRWYITVWNSHGDEYYLIGEKVWNGLAESQFRPFGGYLLIPDKAEERFLTSAEIHKGTWS